MLNKNSKKSTLRNFLVPVFIDNEKNVEEIQGLKFFLIDKQENYVSVIGFGNDIASNLSLPNTIVYNGIKYFVKSIGDYAFDGCSGLVSFEISSGITSIGNSAFWCCNSLSSIKIPTSVINIGEHAFYNCTSLRNIEISENITSIKDCTFLWCKNLTSIEIPIGVTSIGNFAFSGCNNLTSIKLPISVTDIGKSAFCYCGNLKSIEFSNSGISIEDYAFKGCANNATYIVTSNEVKQALLNCNSDIQENQIILNTKDRNELQILYNENKNRIQADYTTESFNTFKEALDNVRRVLDDVNATQTEINHQKEILLEAIRELKVLITKIIINGPSDLWSYGKTKLTVSISPENATNKDVTWDIVSGRASISQDGTLVSKVYIGWVVVRATAKDGSDVSGEKEIHIRVVY